MKKTLIMMFLFCTLFNNDMFSQLSLFPPGVFIDPNSRTGSMQILNTSNNFRQIEIFFKFGYVHYDKNGNKSVIYDDSSSATKYSLIPYLKVFPKKLVIPPNERQTVRFMVTNVSGLEDGTYFTRCFVKSTPTAEQIDTVKEGDVSAAIVFSTQMVGMVAYQKGNVNSSIDIEFIEAKLDTNKVNTYWKIRRKGNSPFWGLINFQMLDSNADFISEATEMIAIYDRKCIMKYPLSDKGFQEGNEYTILIKVTNEREDIPKARRIKFDDINEKVNFKLK